MPSVGRNSHVYFLSASCSHNIYLSFQQLPAWNTRCFKNESGKFEIRLASVESGDTGLSCLGEHVITDEDGKERTFTVTRGDYSPLLKLVNENLNLAKV